MYYLLHNGQYLPLTIDSKQEIGSGGMGVVSRIGRIFGEQSLVAKLFKQPNDPKNPSEAKLQAMLARPPDHIYERINGVSYTQFAWVQYLIVNEQHTVVGYAMPELDVDRSISLNPFIYPREATRLTDYQNSLNYRVQLGANISALMADLHAHGHAFIDFKEQNLRLMPEPNTGVDDDYKGFIVGFIDCDSYRITGTDGQVYPSPVISPEMTSPEYHIHQDISQLDERHDRFVLAIELFKILNYGIHPFYFIPLSDTLKHASHRNTDQFIKARLYAYGLQPHPDIAPLKNSIHTCWPDHTRAMFDQAFLAQDPNDRPTATEWEGHLRGLIYDRQFVVCQHYPDAASHIHFVNKPCHQCLWLDTKAALNPPTNLITERNYPHSPYNGIVNSADIPHEFANLSAADNGATTSNPHVDDALAANRQYEKALQADYHQVNHPETASNPASLGADESDSSAAAMTNAPETALAGDENSSINPGSPSTAPNKAKNPKSKKPWLLPAIIVGMIMLVWVKHWTQTASHSPHDKSASQTSEPSSKRHNRTDSDSNRHSADDSDSEQAYRQAINALPVARKQIRSQLEAIGSGGFFGTISTSTAAQLYQDTLGLSPPFFNAVNALAAQGEPELQQLQRVADSQDIDAIRQLGRQAFRQADVSYFSQQPVDQALAKRFNNAAKHYYWQQQDPAAALYLQAQAVKQQPTQAEYVANLAFYLVKNRYPYAKNFVLYALQAPRDTNKNLNIYMLELASALAVKDDEKAAVGLLLSQYYIANDPAKRCDAMLKYPKTYPELVPTAKKVLSMINEQHNSGRYQAPDACLPPYQWAQS